MRRRNLNAYKTRTSLKHVWDDFYVIIKRNQRKGREEEGGKEGLDIKARNVTKVEDPHKNFSILQQDKKCE